MSPKINPTLSIIIPAFNEIKRIGKTLASIRAYVRDKRLACEVIVVDDGSTDGTSDFVEGLIADMPYLRVLRLPKNDGKGAAVKAGMLLAVGQQRLFMDADSSTDIREFDKLVPYVAQGFDVVVGSRRIEGAVIKTPQHMIREVLGGMFRTLTRAIVPLGIYDTQNGFKLFSAQVAQEIFGALETKGWSFDIEALLLARNLNYCVKEVPIIWVNDNQSRLRWTHMIRMFLDILRLSQTAKQFLKFCLVGVLNTVVDFGIYYALTRGLWTFQDSILVYKALSYLVATVCSFMVNRYWTFAKMAPIHYGELLRFYATVGLGIFVNVGVQYVAVVIFGLHDLVGVLVAAAATAIWGFSFAKFFVFKE